MVCLVWPLPSLELASYLPLFPIYVSLCFLSDTHQQMGGWRHGGNRDKAFRGCSMFLVFI